jgi:hypothetical protein
VTGLVADLGSAAPKHYTFIHIAEPDLTGHSVSWGTPGWSNMVRTVDAQVGRILAAIDASPVLSNQTALIVTADHGGGGVTANAHTEAYHITNYTVPFFLRAPGVPAGADLYSLFGNRANPGTNRTDYTTSPQPVRNGDGSNLALSLLALPTIPGSFMVPALNQPRAPLASARAAGAVGFTWNDPAEEYILESIGNLLLPGSWQPVTEGVATNDTARTFSPTNTAAQPAQFFRLRRQ